MLFVAAWKDLNMIIPSEVRSDRYRQILHDITYMWDLKYDISELIYKTETDSDIENKVMVSKEESEDQFREFGINNRYVVLYLK